MTYEKEIDEAEEMTKKVFVVIIAGFFCLWLLQC